MVSPEFRFNISEAAVSKSVKRGDEIAEGKEYELI